MKKKKRKKNVLGRHDEREWLFVHLGDEILLCDRMNGPECEAYVDLLHVRGLECVREYARKL